MKYFYFSILALLVPFSAEAFQALPKKAPVPENNRMTKAKINLGKQLYFDKRLSADNTVSCNTCHNVLNGSGVDGLPTSKGIKGQFGGRNAPTVVNAAFLSVQFWDGRAKSLEEQAVGPLTNPIEMGMTDHDAVIAKLKTIPGYVKAFKRVFKGKDSLNIDNVGKAIAAYERTLITPNSPFDKYMKGKKNSLSAEAKRGMELFQTTGCVACHQGPNFAGPMLPEGTGFFMRFPTYPDSEFVDKYDLDDDKGRYEETKKDADKHMWRVPTLRNVAMTGPYFHNGKVKTLDEAVRVMASAQLGKTIPEADVKSLVAFLEALTGSIPKQKEPKLP